MVHNVNLNALRVFAIAARYGNFLRAAEALNISHGAVSQRIKQLELDLGITLFERKARGVSLTPNGERYREAVEEALSILATAAADLERVGAPVILHLGASFASRWLMPRMKCFAAQFPSVSITTETHEELLQRNLGLNEIAIWPAKTSNKAPGGQVIRLAELQFVAVCSPHLLRPDWPLDLKTVLSLPLLQDSNRRWERLIDSAGRCERNSLLNFDRSALALEAAINGHGVAIAPTYLIADDLAAERLVEIWRNPESSGEYLFMSWVAQRTARNPVMQTVNWILSEFGLAAVH
ncbi:LysR family transcriptional regulator [Nitratireductor sp. StC3]|uniref:LysR family transcriptional regulator n=1 Tax=Nitratireductor sp. StC3 TaxID=2126741 RepID=UPI000D0DE335|nr:LysR family transcriptional regulator [Nitratireductor sp. StC3]PSM17372.1 hypothetical protein C7T96_15905 [Nitratireductor sp. StC3]